MKCPKCNQDSPQDTRFCGNCGTQLPLAEEASSAAKNISPSPKKELEVGSTLAKRYQIIEELGKGGMGRVYKALDKEINEKVALKLLNPDVATDEKTIERFRNELKLARKISHRNVCRMYDLSTEEGVHYISMEYVPGDDLKSSIRRMGPLSSGKAISVAKQVCEGLAEAHRLGVVHRDLKPQNIMIDQDGNARIMDFGIAQSVKTKGITETGVIIGTPEYMSVEQVEAKEVDHRSDIYSLGVILYEMVTGKVPFEGDTPLSVAVKHTTEPPADPRELNAQIPEDLSRVILRCMEKNKENRYQSVEQVRGELNNIEKGLPTAERECPWKKATTTKQITVSFTFRRSFVPVAALVAIIIVGAVAWHLFSRTTAMTLPMERASLAVLPFENNSEDASLDLWRIGLAELLTADLSQSGFIRVLPGDKVFSILRKLDLLQANKYSSGDLKRMATRGRVDYILMGRFLTKGENLVITATVQNPITGLVAGSRRIECQGAKEIPLKMDELSKRIKSDLNLSGEQISGDIDKELAKITSSSPEALRYFMEGWRNHAETGHPRRTIELMKRATAIDGEFAAAYRIMGHAYYELGLVSESWNCLKKALELKNRLATRQFYLIQGELYSMSEQTYSKAIKAYDRLLEIYPEDGEGNSNLGRLLCYDLELWDKAIERFEVLIRSNEENSEPYLGQAEAYMAKGMYDKARQTLETYLASFPTQAWIHERIVNVYLCQRKLDLAQREVEKALSVDPTSIYPSFAGDICHYKGDLAGAEEEYRRILKAGEPASQCYGRSRLAALYLSQGRFDESKRQLEQARGVAEKARDIEWKIWSQVYLAQLHLACGKPQQALREWERARNMAARNNLDWEPDLHLKGLIYLQMKSIDLAQKTADELKKILQTKMNKKLIRYHHHLEGMIELERGNFSKATVLFKKALSLVPFQHSESDDQALFIYPLALAFYQSGDLEKAQEQFTRIITLTTGRLFFGDMLAKSLYMLGRIHQDKGCREEAMKYYARFTELWKDADPGTPELRDAKKRLVQLESQTQVFGQSGIDETP